MNHQHYFVKNYCSDADIPDDLSTMYLYLMV